MTQTLSLPGSTVVEPTKADLFDNLAADLIAAAMEAVNERGVFHLALSGGSTPEPFYMSLVTDPRWRGMPWASTHVWIVDERQVPMDHEKANIRMMREAMLEHVSIPGRQVHPMPVMDDDPAGAYEDQLAEAFRMTVGESLPRIDFILLGMGDDGHTASLFPESPGLDVADRWIVCNDGEKVVPPPRVTMTYPLLNAGRKLAVLLAGTKKHAMLATVSDRMRVAGPDVQNLPITGIEPSDGTLTWYLDEAAATGSEPEA